MVTQAVKSPNFAASTIERQTAGEILADLAATSAGNVRPADESCHLTPEDYLRIVDQFSHDIRTPLCVISEYASLIRDGIIGDDVDERNQAMDITRARVSEIQLQTDALMTLAKLASGNLHVSREMASVAEILQEAAERVTSGSRTSGIAFEPVIDPMLPTIECDPRLTRCVLVNMLWSVLKAAPAEASIRLEACPQPDEQQMCFRVSSSAMRRYEVAPAGLISQVKMICEKHRTRRQRIDVALGLAYDVAHLLGGQISFNDDSIEQPVLEFTLPMRADCK